MKKKNIIITIIISIILLVSIILLIILLNGNNKEKKEVKVVKVGEYQERLEIGNVIIKNYDDYKELFESNELDKDSFKDNNYVVLDISYDSCSEEDLKIENYNIEGNTLNVLISYKAKCGLCAPSYIYYLIPIDKSITDIDTEIDYEARNNPRCPEDVAYKPIIYLYPEKEMNVEVKLGNKEYLTVSYPKYNNSWNVRALPNGDLYDLETNRYYYGLYWEGNNHKSEVKEDGFVVEGKDSLKFLEEKLEILGLTEREADEFIIYWLPKLEENKYNYIRFETIEEINNYMPLEISPKPDTVIRVLMDYKGLDKPITVKEQKLVTPKRVGFTVVEWGGSIIR